MRYMVAMVTGSLEKKYDVTILCFISFCGKFHTDTINRTVFEKKFVELVVLPQEVLSFILMTSIFDVDS